MLHHVPWTLYLDFETSGLEPEFDRPLEYGALVVNHRNEVIVERTRLIRCAADDLLVIIKDSHPRVQQMHTDNGLWADLFAANAPGGPNALFLDQLEDDLALLLDPIPEPKRAVLGGFSPHFDRRWLEYYAPSFLRKISHRNLDISTLRHTVQHRFGHWEPSPEPVPHRGLGDCQRAFAYYQWYIENVVKA